MNQGNSSPTAAAGLRHQPVAVVDLGPEIIEAMTGRILAVEIHGGERGNAQLLDIFSRKELARHLDLSRGAGAHLELIGADDALALEQRIQSERALLRCRGSHQPEIGEPGKLLARGARRIDRQSTCRQPVGLVAPEHAEV